MSFEVIPSLTLKDERAMVVVDGEYKAIIDDKDQPIDPIDLVERLSADHKKLFIIDVDGIGTGEPQLEVLQEMPTYVEVWVDVGIRSAEDIYDPFMSGASRVVVGTKSLESLAQLKEMEEVSDGLMLGLDFSEGVLVTSPEQDISLDRLLKHARESSTLKGLLVELLTGGVSKEDLRRMRDTGKDLYVTTSLSRREEFEPLTDGIIVGIRDVMEGLRWRS